VTSADLYELVPSLSRDLPGLELGRPPWDLVARIGAVIHSLAASGQLRDFGSRGENLFVHPDAELEPGSVIRGPAVIGAGCFVSATAYLREGVILAAGARVGHAVELKSSIVGAGSALAHLCYVGNSLVGAGVNVEAGVVVANHHNESPGTQVTVRWRAHTLETGLAKFGAVIGDHAKIGANSVLSPGSIIEPGAVVPRLTLVAQ